MNILFKIFTQPTRNDILNSGLSLAMSFGTNFNKPIQSRLGRKFILTDRELDEYNQICRAAMTDSHNFIYETLMSTSKNFDVIHKKVLRARWKIYLLSKYPWIKPSNLRALFSQGIYFAMKDGWTEALK